MEPYEGMLYNADIDEAEWPRGKNEPLESEDDVGVSFFDLRQRVLINMEHISAFRVVTLGLLRKLRTCPKEWVPYNEVEDALGRFFRFLDHDMQRFASLHEQLKSIDESVESASDTSIKAREGMREIAVVLLACGELQRRTLDWKLSVQKSVA